MWHDVLGGVEWLEAQTGQTFGRGPRPLLVAVRSSGVTSMPGMLETVLDVGIDDAVAEALADLHSAEFATDTLERFRRGYRRSVHDGGDIPDAPHDQLRGAIEAVVSSWSSSRVAAYRAHHGLVRPDGVVILLQATVFGNLDAELSTGVLFTRNPSSGASEPFGEWLAAAQGDTWCRGRATASPSPRCATSSSTSTRNWSRRAVVSRRQAPTFRTSSSPSRRANSGSCSRGWRSGHRGRRCGWR